MTSLLACVGGELVDSPTGGDEPSDSERFYQSEYYDLEFYFGAYQYVAEMTKVQEDSFDLLFEGNATNRFNPLESYPIAMKMSRNFSDGTFYFDSDDLPEMFTSYECRINKSIDSPSKMTGLIWSDGFGGTPFNFEMTALNPGSHRPGFKKAVRSRNPMRLTTISETVRSVRQRPIKIEPKSVMSSESNAEPKAAR